MNQQQFQYILNAIMAVMNVFVSHHATPAQQAELAPHIATIQAAATAAPKEDAHV